ncbi:aKG-HExxH-type peptide beta-hydroxylase [Archangium lansingense]|uniref:HEXXH motif-containing putative peptide modification protein n=1 Tax=Archangium lansingense TaxID=2995310 RepID=A0ABT4AQ92_9BACT|nr:HEXXH motif-containing putative peptide modification protein [Archangium lansinium]MCY1083436.1 HEXXH motif-containing putative peptide modification protein [Archangium lansinium]
MRQDEIRQLDERLQHHDPFGDSSKVVGRVIERYKFALEVLARQDDGLRELLGRVERLDADSVDVVFGDLLVRAELEAAISRLETSGPVAASSESLRWMLGEALASIAKDRGMGIARRAMGRDFVVGPARRSWVWDLPDEPTRVGDKLRESIRTGFMPGAESSVEIIRPTPRMVEGLERACALLYRLVPTMADSIFRHLHSIAVANIRSPRGRLLTGSGGDGTPCMIFIDPDELENPWDTAGHILHEGIHLKLSDLIRTVAIVTDDGPVELPWRRKTALSNCVFAYHAYAHMQVFRAAVQHLGPSCYAEFGAPHDYDAPAHAMSVVNNDSRSPFSRAEARLHFLHEQLAGALAPRVTSYGRKLVSWLWETIRPLEAIGGDRSEARAEHAADVPTAPGRAPSSARYRQGQGISLRRSPSSEVLFALEPGSQKIVTLNLPAWLAFELCDGKTEEELLSAYATSLGLGAEHAWAQLAPTLEGLTSSGMIDRVPEGAHVSKGVSP